MEQPPRTPTGTANAAQMHMHQQQQRSDVLGSPSLGSQPMTPQQQMLQAQTPGGQYSHEFQQQYQGGVPPSPGTPVVGQAPHAPGSNIGTDGSPGMYNRQMHPQMMQQQQMMQPQGGQMTGMPPQYSGYPTTQQQQWAQHQQMQQQAHYARTPQMMGGQPGQQVMIRRVPYPQGTVYPPGIQPQGGQQPGQAFPARPGGPAGPQQMQRPQYPQGAGQPPPQYPAYPPGQQAYPQGAYPQQQMYPPRAPPQGQVGQPMRPYISPQGGIVAPQVYTNNPTQAAPQTPQTPQQAPFTPNGTRFPQPTPSPHYAAGADIRSPPLMSPNQPQQMQAPPMPRPLSNGEMVNPPMRMPVCPPAPSHGNHLPSQFFSHDPAVLGNINAENCLLGCTIHVFDIERFATDKTDMLNLQIAVKMRGGELDSHPKSYMDKMQSITHVIVDCYRSQSAQQALKDRKRVVTLQWLAEVLMTGKMEVPNKLAHLPSFCSKGAPPNQPGVEQNLPCLGKYFSLSGFDEMERAACKWMIEAIGGRVTPNFSRNNHFLLCKQPGGEKFEKAREWEIQCFNYQWLVDLYISGRIVEGEPSRYMVGNPGCDVTTTPYNLEVIHESTKHLLAPWRQPIQVHQDHWKKAVEMRQSILNDDNIFVNRRFKSNQHDPPTMEQMVMAEKQRKEKGIQQNVVVAFSGVDDDVKDVLGKKLMYLGGRVTENVAECTHLVAVQGGRSEKLLEAIALGKNIVNSFWIIHGYECNHFMDTFDYFLRDEDSEKHLGYNCKRSVLRARNRPVFEDVTFYITPNVEPSQTTLTRLIRLAGGKVDDTRPDPQVLADCIERDSLYIVISCDADIRSLNYLLECNFPIYSSEFALMALLRQEIQPHMAYRLMPPPRHIPRPQLRQAPQPVHQNEPPRVRVP